MGSPTYRRSAASARASASATKGDYFFFLPDFFLGPRSVVPVPGTGGRVTPTSLLVRSPLLRPIYHRYQSAIWSPPNDGPSSHRLPATRAKATVGP